LYELVLTLFALADGAVFDGQAVWCFN